MKRSAIVLLLAASSFGAEYHVGPAQTYTTIGAVPWYRLVAGDTVYIHYRATPYREKILISSRGTASQWIRVLGVPGPNGERPVISGENATTGTNMHWRTGEGWAGSAGVESSGIISVLVGDGQYAITPGYIEIAGLTIQDAVAGMHYTTEGGAAGTYPVFSSAVYMGRVQHILIRDCEIANAQAGIFNQTGSDQGSTTWWGSMAEDIVIRGNYFHNIGAVGDDHEHVVYVQGARPVIENNRFGAMRPGAFGNHIKSRSAGDIIRYNYMEGQVGGMFLNLVEDEDGRPGVTNLPYYAHDFVYGNLLVNLPGSTTACQAQTQWGPGCSSLIRWNADHYNDGRAVVPGARLYFYNNTWVDTGDTSTWFSAGVFSTHNAGDSCPTQTSITGLIDVRNNIFLSRKFTASGTARPIYFDDGCGIVNFTFGANWISPVWSVSSSAAYSGTATGKASLFVSPANNTPGFVNLDGMDVHLAEGSTALGRGSALSPDLTNNPLGLDLTPNQQYLNHQQLEPRLVVGEGSDLGALGGIFPQIDQRSGV